jgi:hypothetical protein
MPLPNFLQIGDGHPALHPPVRSTTAPPASLALSPHPSLAIAAQLAEIQLSRPDSPQQDERNKLAELLRDYLQTNPEPIIGSPDNPFPSADDLGIRGHSILSAFIEHADMETFTCTFCGDIRTDIEDSLAHQRTFLKYCRERERL